MDIYQSNPFAKCIRKCVQYVDRWVKPSLQPFVAAPRLVELVYLALKYGENGRRRVTCLELGSERMSGEILSGLFFILFEGFFEDYFEIGSGCCRYRRPGGGARSGRLTHDE